MPFEKGNPGGPGRPRKTDQQRNFERKCQEWAELFAFDRLKKWADSADFNKCRWALEQILDRGFGKPAQTQIVEANVTADTGTSIADLEREASELLRGGAGEGGGMATEGPVDGGK